MSDSGAFELGLPPATFEAQPEQETGIRRREAAPVTELQPDIIGRRFGSLEVVGKRGDRWVCKCDCGETTTRLWRHLIHSKACRKCKGKRATATQVDRKAERAPIPIRPAAAPAYTGTKAAFYRLKLLDHELPLSRRDCEGTDRPCPLVRCAFNLYLDADEDTGHVKLNFPGLEPHEMRQSCALDIAEDGGQTSEVVADALNITKQAVLQIEEKAVLKLKRRGIKLRSWLGE